MLTVLRNSHNWKGIPHWQRKTYRFEELYRIHRISSMNMCATCAYVAETVACYTELQRLLCLLFRPVKYFMASPSLRS